MNLIDLKGCVHENVPEKIISKLLAKGWVHSGMTKQPMRINEVSEVREFIDEQKKCCSDKSECCKETTETFETTETIGQDDLPIEDEPTHAPAKAKSGRKPNPKKYANKK